MDTFKINNNLVSSPGSLLLVLMFLVFVFFFTSGLILQTAFSASYATDDCKE